MQNRSKLKLNLQSNQLKLWSACLIHVSKNEDYIKNEEVKPILTLILSIFFFIYSYSFLLILFFTELFKRKKIEEQTLFSCYFQLTEKARVQVFGFPG